jgi:hypothetical protein
MSTDTILPLRPYLQTLLRSVLTLFRTTYHGVVLLRHRHRRHPNVPKADKLPVGSDGTLDEIVATTMCTMSTMEQMVVK